MKLRVLEAARRELVEAAHWYEDSQPDLGEEFFRAYEEAIARIMASPLSCSRMETIRSRRNIRRCLLKRFPYYVPFEVFADELVVMAVAHAKRRPNYWIRRR